MGESLEGKLTEGGRLAVVRWVAREVMVHEPSLRSWLRKVAHSNEVDDIVQESYFRIVRLKDVSHIHNGGAYLFTTARNVIYEKARNCKVGRLTNVENFDDMYSEYPSPERSVIASDYFKRVDKIIDRLPDRCRNIFRMRKIEGLSQREVATIMEVPEHTVENDVCKGLSLILKALAEGEQKAEVSLEWTVVEERRALGAGN